MRRQCSLEAEPLPQGFDMAEPERNVHSSPAPLLAAAVVAGVLSPREVVLVARTRLEGRPLSEVARSLGRPYDAVRKERRRAEAALATFVERYDAEGSW
jgi:DNA-directed RNA polymerase specialized sigma24 family protein